MHYIQSKSIKSLQIRAKLSMATTSHRMLTAEREQCILDLLKQSDILTVSALCERLEVSEATIRRD